MYKESLGIEDPIRSGNSQTRHGDETDEESLHSKERMEVSN